MSDQSKSSKHQADDLESVSLPVPGFEDKNTGNRYIVSHLFPIEALDVIRVWEAGAEKHGARSWEFGGLNTKTNHDSMFHHLAESYSGRTVDPETGLHPALHLACRALMQYTLYKREQEGNKDE